MNDNSLDRLIGDHTSLNKEAEQLVDEIEHMSMEEENVDEIKNKDVY